MIDSELRSALEVELGQRIDQTERVSGGDINDAFALRFTDGARAFLKTNAHAPAAMFAAEARGLGLLAEAGALRVPRVIASSPPGAARGFLLLEWVEAARPGQRFDEELGRGLAALHRAHLPSFGLDHDNFIGRLPQSNRAHDDWVDFLRSERLGAQLELAVESGRASGALRRGFERLFEKLPELVGPREPPARLHGDLWGGNLLVGERGEPCLIDPAVYGGHREIDLAMMRLFGGFGPRVFDAYHEAYPLAPGHAERVALYQLYPLLVHVNLFGGGYARSVERALGAYA
ncbi:MAG TPA: fructosamine kinase family protein [Polyangiaceae bacterium]